MGAACSGPCVIRYLVQIGKIINEVWNSPLRDMIIDLVTQLDIERGKPVRRQQLSLVNVSSPTSGSLPRFRCRYARRKPFTIFRN